MLGRMRKRLFGGALRRILIMGLLGIVVAVATIGFSIKPARAWTRGYDTIIFLHGFDGGSSSTGPIDCFGSTMWGDAVNYLKGAHDLSGTSTTWHRQDFRAIKFYNSDYNCGRTGANTPADPWPYGQISEDLHNPLYTQFCQNYYPDGTNWNQDGTENESIYHLSCLFAWYLYENFQSSWNVEIVTHSMGGLIVRNAIYQVWKNKATWTMPPSLPYISDVVTIGTPHGGTNWFANTLCNSCTQTKEMVSGSSFMNEMLTQAQNPQAKNPGDGNTDWTMLSSDRDPVELSQPGTETYMDGGHRIKYVCSSGQPCYSHGAYLTDSADSFSANQYYCDWCARNASMSYYTGPHSLHEMFYALWRTDW